MEAAPRQQRAREAQEVSFAYQCFFKNLLLVLDHVFKTWPPD
jgi:hypothetical protein